MVLNQSNCVIAVIGATGSGKTTFINLASGSNFRAAGGFESCTDAVVATMPFNLDGQQVTLIDTPGFDDINKTDAEILMMLAEFLSSS